MKKKKMYTTIILLSFLLIGIQPVLAVIHVPSETKDHNGKTIAIFSGMTYTLIDDVDEALFIQDTNITIDGKDSNGNYHTVTGPGLGNTGVGVDINGKNGIAVRNLTITGFPIGIWINNSNPGPATPQINTFENNTIFGCTTAGIRLSGANKTNLIDNTIKNNNNSSQNAWGILISTSGNTNNFQFGNILKGNTITGNDGGIQLNTTSSFNRLEENTVTGNTFSGIFIDSQSNNNILEDNNSSSNRDGIFLRNSNYNTVKGNICSNNEYGIRLWDSSDNTLKNNTVSGNTQDGIYLDPSNNNIITNNDIENNARGIYILNSSNNEVFNNNLIDNTTSAEVIGGSGNDFGGESTGGNHWSDYQGVDDGSEYHSGIPRIAGDGIGDTDLPHLGVDIYPFINENGWLPIANAGDDKTIECACQTTEGTQVTLDSGGSTCASTYTWTGPFVEGEGTVTGATPTVTLNPGCLGEYEITLVINDGEFETETDTVIITVVDTTPPDVIPPGDVTIGAMGPDPVPVDDERIQAFLAGVSANDNCDPEPTITDDAPAEFPPGDTVVTFTATDASSNESTKESTVTVMEAAESSLRIIPKIINREGRLEQILAVIRFPVGTTEEDIDIETPLVLYPGESPIGVEATSQRIVTWCMWGTLRVAVFARFPKDDVTAGVPEDGPAEMMVIGRFTDGQYFYGFDNVWICSWNW